MRLTLEPYPQNAYTLEKRPTYQGWITAASITGAVCVAFLLLASLRNDPIHCIQWSSLLFLVLLPAAFAITRSYNHHLRSVGRQAIADWESRNLEEYNRVCHILNLPYEVTGIRPAFHPNKVYLYLESPPLSQSNGAYSEHCHEILYDKSTDLCKLILDGTVTVIHFPKSRLYQDEAGQWFHEWGEPCEYIEIPR